MIAQRFQCPQCHKNFVGTICPHSEPFPCAHCGIDLAAMPNQGWFLIQAGRRLGPYSLRELKDLDDGACLAPNDLITSEEAAASLLPRDLAGFGARTIEDVLEETQFSAPGIDKGPAQDNMPRPQMTLRLADFRLARKLGSGGMGAVYLAIQESLGRRMALKFLAPSLARVPNYVCRFFREAQVLSRLHHPNFAEFYGVGEEKGIPFFAMEYIEGFSTAALLRYRDGPLSVGDALYIVVKCLDALAYAHELNVIHRDIKPQNILLTSLGKVKITDLGLAKPLQQDLSLTESGLTMGTPRFMAPEQAKDAKHADQRSDIYSLGGVLYFFLTGRVPFDGDTALKLLLAKEKGFFPPARRFNPEIPPALETIVDRMLARDPRNRFSSCAEVRGALQNLRLAHDYPSFQLLHTVPGEETEGLPEPGLVEILLIHDDVADILLTQQALVEKHIPSRLHTVQDGLEALAFLAKAGRFAKAPTPELIVLGRDLDAPGILETLESMRDNPALSAIPLVVLARSPHVRQILQENRLPVHLTVTCPEDLAQFEALLESLQGMCLTIVEAPSKKGI